MEIDHREQEAESPEFKQYMRAALFTTPEGCIFMAGLVIALLYIIWLTLNWIWVPEVSQVLLAMTATNIVFGRAAGMSVGYTMGLDHIVVVPINMLIETILVLLFYPLFVFSWRHLIVIQALKNFMERTSKAAETHHETVRRYGMLGLFVFVWSPFWMTGPVVGCAIGFLLGLRPWLNLTVVLSGTYLAITCWAIFLREVHDRIAVYSPFASIILVVILILIVVVSRVLHGLYREGVHRKSKSKVEGKMGNTLFELIC